MKIDKIIQTCSACPSQWELTLGDGRMIYARYRWGWLTANVSDNPTQIIEDALDGSEIYAEQIRDGLDGVMDTKEMLDLLTESKDVSAALLKESTWDVKK